MSLSLQIDAWHSLLLISREADGPAELLSALAGPFPEIRALLPRDGDFAYLCFVMRTGNLAAAQIAKARGVLTDDNAAKVLEALLINLMDNRCGYEDLTLEGLELPEYIDMPGSEQAQITRLVRWLSESFAFSPEMARKVVDVYSVECPMPLSLLSALARLPLNLEGHEELLSCAIHTLFQDRHDCLRLSSEQLDEVKARSDLELLKAYSRELIAGESLESKTEPKTESETEEEGRPSLCAEEYCFAENCLRNLGRLYGEHVRRFGEAALGRWLNEKSRRDASESRAVLALARCYRSLFPSD